MVDEYENEMLMEEVTKNYVNAHWMYFTSGKLDDRLCYHCLLCCYDKWPSYKILYSYKRAKERTIGLLYSLQQKNIHPIV
jgi:hypothetical protein